ncbi:DUF308 domain-containing protein [Plebeiibacterium marinum]|uniref:DUF308 domain-containing protein n=1 Tax=Plebeiibacterium marinum TaxID=2992111 RepID=A0AAE3SM29_9BACT|nr:DUF308 domain-containing protein [Plebeiobacterium marinum]MCW3808059.1 DUF308 domain-containing protein [Plebeiobacterium marinum]
MKLEQKQGLKRRTFELVGDKLKMTYKTSSETKEWTVNIDSIGNDILIEKKSRKGSYIFGGFMLVFGFFMLAAYTLSHDNTISPWAIIFMGIFYVGLGVLITLGPLKSELHITGGIPVIFFLESPSRIEVEEFANALIEKSRTIILERFSKIDTDVPEETMMNQLFWLRNRGFISEHEYEAKKKEYKTKKLMN